MDLVDCFKSVVGMNKADCKEVQDEVLSRWKTMCCNPSRRNTAETVCILFAEFTSLKRIRHNDMHRATSQFETFVNSKRDTLKTGLAVFEYLEDAVWKYEYFRRCALTPDLFPPDLFPNFDDKSNNDKSRQLMPFIQYLASVSQLSFGKEIESVALYILCHYRFFSQHEASIKGLEVVTLWMLLCKPPWKERLRRVFTILDLLHNSLPNIKVPEIKLEEAEKKSSPQSRRKVFGKD